MSTLIFPQLVTGSIAQFPIRKHVIQRTIVNRAVGEQLIKMADPEGGIIGWKLQYSGLSDAEVRAFETLFEACEGRLHSFSFVDPLGNLLRWSENLDESVWQTSLLATAGAEDPNDGTAAYTLTNGSQSPQSISQAVESPAGYTYTFSVWIRSRSAEGVRLSITNGGVDVSVTRHISAGWERIQVTASMHGSGDQITCSIEVPGGSAVDVFGAQLDAQSDASEYRKSNDRSGVYMTRFDQDDLEWDTYGPDNHSMRIRVVTVQE
jgi:hypothetical protein